MVDDYGKTQAYLYGLRNRGSSYGIDRIRYFLDALAHPECDYPIIHVAGTNGKGSVCAMLERIYRESGRRTGLFTSPHLVYLGERIQVNGQPLSPRAITSYVEQLRSLAEQVSERVPELHPTFFEFMTGLAFLYFRDSEVDMAILETGLGGRLDATNSVVPEVAVITSIGLDHQQQLGDTIEAIAMEKAGIIKPGKPVVMGWLPEAAEQVIRRIAEERGSRVHAVKERFGEVLSLYPRVRLEGDYQRINAGTASLVVEVLEKRFPVPQVCVDQGLQQVEWRGRWQRVCLDRGRELILDTTHNAEGVRMLQGHLEKWFQQTGKKPIVITGMLGEVRTQALMPLLAQYASALILVPPKQPQACSVEVLRAAIPSSFTKPILSGDLDTLFSAPGVCSQGERNGLILATGSIYLIGEICERLFENEVPEDGALQDRI